MSEVNNLIGIRLEDKSVWEKRVPLVPADIERLTEAGNQFVIQPSALRVYEDEAYRRAGAAVSDDLSAARVVLAVKEVPLDLLRADCAYAFFAHVIKGQPHNMKLLHTLLERRITLIDYERITDHHGHRLVKFGLEAGQAGMIDSLWALGQRLTAEGIETPLADVQQAYRYRDLAHAKEILSDIGRRLAVGSRLPDGPIIVGFTGRGSVSQGAQEVFDVLPHVEIEANELSRVARRKGDRIYKVVFDKDHLARPKDPTRKFVETEYYAHPERFTGRLHEFLPHLTVLINGIFWTDEFPRFITREHIRQMWRRGQRRLRVIGDITCDLDGAIELTYKATQPDAPTYVYQPQDDSFVDGLAGDGVVVLAVDNLPCELSKDASDQFSRALSDFVPAIAAADFSQPFGSLDLPAEIRRAIVAHGGDLTPDHQYLRQALAAEGF